jgi:hypothetical protein
MLPKYLNSGSNNALISQYKYFMFT